MSFDSRRHSTKINRNKVIKKKNTNRKCSNENEIKNEIKVKSKYWHECQHCSHQHSKKKFRKQIFLGTKSLF